MEDHGWYTGSVECFPPDPHAGGKVCVTYNLSGQPTQRIAFDPSLLPHDAQLRKDWPVRWRIVDGEPEFDFPEVPQPSAEEWKTAGRSARDIIIAGGATPLGNDEAS